MAIIRSTSGKLQVAGLFKKQMAKLLDRIEALEETTGERREAESAIDRARELRQDALDECLTTLLDIARKQSRECFTDELVDILNGQVERVVYHRGVEKGAVLRRQHALKEHNCGKD